MAAVKMFERSGYITSIKVVAIALAVLTMSAGAQASEPTRWETLHAIHTVENPHNSRRPGPRGELGAYQFRSDTWKMYSRLHFSHALDRSRSDEVAVRHYEWIREGLIRAGMDASAYNIALAWNAGLSRVVKGNASAASRNYAERVTNIAFELHRRLDSERLVLTDAR
jgi:hypothetical protein